MKKNQMVKTVVEETVVEATVVEATVVEATVVEETVVEATVVEETVVEETVVEETNHGELHKDLIDLCLIDKVEDAVGQLGEMGEVYGYDSDIYNHGLAHIIDTVKKVAFAQGQAAVNFKETKIHKGDIVVSMLQRECGATIADIANATGWQDHSIRGFISTKKKAGLNIEKTIKQKMGEKAITTYYAVAA